MNNLSYCGLVDAKIRASGKDLPIDLNHNFNIKNSVYILFGKTVEIKILS